MGLELYSVRDDLKRDLIGTVRAVADNLTAAAEKLRPVGLRGGYHNHQLEFTPLDGKLPIEVIASNTPKDFMLQLDGGALASKSAWPGLVGSNRIPDGLDRCKPVRRCLGNFRKLKGTS